MSAGLPGTGISYSRKIGSTTRNSASPRNSPTANTDANYGCGVTVLITLGILLMLTRSTFLTIIGLALLATGVTTLITSLKQDAEIARARRADKDARLAANREQARLRAEAERVSTISLNLETDPSYERDKATIGTLLETAQHLGTVQLLRESQISGKTYVSAIRTTFEPITSLDEHQKRYQIGSPTCALIQHTNNPYASSTRRYPEVVFAPGVILTSTGHQDPIKTFRWNTLMATTSITRVAEPENRAPQDAEIIGTRWQHQRVDGGPDRRYSDNPILAIIQYYDLTLTEEEQVALRLRFTSEDALTKFLSLLGVNTPSQGQHERSRTRSTPRSTGPAAEDPYAILGIKPGATREEIRAAYINQSKQYHPDRVANLGAELQELAESKMKEINAAYEALQPE